MGRTSGFSVYYFPRNTGALATYQALPPSHKREYVEWIIEAKQDETRRKRLAQAIAWMAEGKARNWEYETKRSSRKRSKDS